MAYLLNRRKYLARRSNPAGAPKNIEDATVTIASTVAYTGNPVTPAVTVSYDGATLTVNVDYILNYVDNVNVGDATVVVTGIGDCTGSVVKTFRITGGVAPAVAWADFDLENLGLDSHVASASLLDSGATYEPGRMIDPYSIQVLSDGRLLFSGQQQGHVYIWGFENGHSFEVKNFKSSYDSRLDAIPSLGSAWISSDGAKLLTAKFSNNNIAFYDISTAYDFSTASAGATGTVTTGHDGDLVHMAFSANGLNFFHKAKDGSTLYRRVCGYMNPMDLGATSSVNLSEIAGSSRTWGGFCFSPDGMNMVAASGSGDMCVHKFALSTAWDISTMTLESETRLMGSFYHHPYAVAVNDEGTKMLVFDRNGYDSSLLKFYEYNLT